MNWPARVLALALLVCGGEYAPTAFAAKNVTRDYPVKSGLRPWVDPATPADRQVYISSRGRRWELTMSDEFNVPGRDFRPGKDHIWTSLEKPDGVNGAKQLYSHNMTSTACDDDGTCYYYIKIVDDVQNITVYNMYTNPPGYQTVGFQYRAAMAQSWNKFCFQGGMLEVRAQLPGAVSNKSGNPDLAKGPNGRVASMPYYPTWPGIWLLGNLGRAIFSGSTNRMWPFSYNRCEPDVFNPSFQRISACNSNPGYGLNPNQGRGAPEIDLVEGGGTSVSSSIQLGPGMPENFRQFPVNTSMDQPYCIYGGSCTTPGANLPDVPTAYYKKVRGHKSWYQGLRYQANPFCDPVPAESQTYEAISRSIRLGITQNGCNTSYCPGSNDVNADLGLVDGKGPKHWGINHNGTCFPLMNAYFGSYLCDPDNQWRQCSSPRNSSTPKTNIMEPFHYQMDAISSNWPLHLAAYTDYLTYQVEWVTGKNGYVRWNLDSHPIFEIPAKSIEEVPQDKNNSNPIKIMPEEPMYIIFNVALSTSWGSTPPNPGQPCRGDGKDKKVNKICDSFPMYMKIDYVRLYQDLADDLDADNYMQIGCDPASHPTREWIDGHIEEYTDYLNLAIDVQGGAPCSHDDDCTISTSASMQHPWFTTGRCINKRCDCTSPSWGGPRCTTVLNAGRRAVARTWGLEGYGPAFPITLGLGGTLIVLTFMSMSFNKMKEHSRLLRFEETEARQDGAAEKFYAFATPSTADSVRARQKGSLVVAQDVT